MIVGVGIDLVEVERFTSLESREDVYRQFLTAAECREIRNSRNEQLAAARSFATKEALLKALGCGLHEGYFWHDIELLQGRHPLLHGRIKQLADSRSISKIHVAHSSTKRYSAVYIILES